MDDLSDLSLLDHIARQDRPFHMETLGIIHHVLPPRGSGGPFRLFQLLQGGEGGLVGEIILSRCHDPAAKGPPLRGDMGSGHQYGLRVGQQRFLGGGSHSLGIGFQELRQPLWLGIIDGFQGASGLDERPHHAVDMPVIQVGGGKKEFPRLHHRAGLALGRIGHTVGNLHAGPPQR